MIEIKIYSFKYNKNEIIDIFKKKPKNGGTPDNPIKIILKLKIINFLLFKYCKSDINQIFQDLNENIIKKNKIV